MTVVPATGSYLGQILRDSYHLWSEELSPQAYASYWEAQRRTPWGAAHLDRVALVTGDTVVSSAKRYDLSARIDGRIRRVIGIGAVFTSPSHRRRGAARELITRMLETAVAEGYEFAALFSEIDPAFYERLDFVPVPLLESRLVVRRKNGVPAMLVRAGDDRDLPAIAEMSARRSAPCVSSAALVTSVSSAPRFALDRSEDLIRFGIAKRRLRAGLSAPGVRQVEFLVAEEGYTAVAYLVCVQENQQWFIEDAGDRDPTGARLGAMLQTMLGRTPGERSPDIRAWWPHTLTPPQIDIVERYPTREVLMIRPLTDRTLPLPPLGAETVVYSRLDYF